MSVSKPLPKSLHTVTAIINVARHCQTRSSVSDESAVHDALRILGYHMSEDPAGLRAMALKQMAAPVRVKPAA